MKKLILSSLFIVLSLFAISQVPAYEWAGNLAGSAAERGQSIAVDKSGNVYTTGYFMDKVDFDPDAKATNYLSSNGSYDIFVSKLDSKGKFVWAINIGGSDDDAGNSIRVDASGNIYVTGFFQSKFDFDPGSGTTNVSAVGASDIFVCKLDDSGNLIWVSQMGGTDDESGNGVDFDASGNVYATGYFYGTCDFDPNPKANVDLTSSGGSDIFVLKLDSKGNYVWAGQMGGADDDFGNAIALDSIGYVFTTGNFIGSGDFDPTVKGTYTMTAPSADADVFVSKIDVKGNFTWAVPAGGKTYDTGTGIAVDAVGNNYTTGYFYGTVDFDPGVGKGQVYNLTPNGNYDIFVWKLNASGAFVWARNMGGSDDDAGLSIALDNNKNVYTTGVFGDVADFDPSSNTSTLTSNGYWDLFLSKLDVSGNYVWSLGVGDSDDEGGISITVDKLNTVYSTGGYYSSSVDFDPGTGTSYLSNARDQDAYVLKLSLCKASFTDLPAKSCNSYTYNGNTYFKSGDYINKLKNSVGCDSVVTLKLKINSPTFETINAGACDSYTINGQTYNAEGSYTQTLMNKAGCDSFLVIDLKFLTSTGTLTSKACNTYTANGKTYTKSGKYTQTLKNKAGCDSTLTLNLSIYSSSSSTINKSACEDFTMNGTTYTKTGTYNQKILNNASCDSNIILNLIVNYSSSSILSISTCKDFKLNAQTYNKSGIYNQTIPNVKGCDSLIKLYLSINNTASTIAKVACQSFKLNDQTYTESGTYSQTIMNSKGCDSAITLNLTINKVITSVTNIDGTLTSDQVSAAYQWMDCNNGNAPILGEIYQSYTPLKTGNYAVEITKNNCTDKSNCLAVKVGGIKNSNSIGIQVFPNPTSSELNIVVINSIKDATLKILGMDGKMVFLQTNLSGNNFKVSLDDLSKGAYFIEINSNGNVSRIKAFKN